MLAGKLSVVCWLVVSERAGPIALGRGSSVTMLLAVLAETSC